MFIEVETKRLILQLLCESYRVLRAHGLFVLITNTLEFYRRNWLSCKVDHVENKFPLQSGQKVKTTLMPENVVVTDYFWSHEDYLQVIKESGFLLKETYFPKGRDEDLMEWSDEKAYAPYVVYLLQKMI